MYDNVFSGFIRNTGDRRIWSKARRDEYDKYWWDANGNARDK
ncbi:hypothetical protein [Epilithonimonas arachidiradicis]|nr:hypothetical protein [Epilithonimonas arachidiradicis]